MKQSKMNHSQESRLLGALEDLQKQELIPRECWRQWLLALHGGRYKRVKAPATVALDEHKRAHGIVPRDEQAEQLGRRAFHNGMKCCLHYDLEMQPLLKNMQPGEGIPVMEAWYRGWTIENLAAPIE